MKRSAVNNPHLTPEQAARVVARRAEKFTATARYIGYGLAIEQCRGRIRKLDSAIRRNRQEAPDGE